MPSPIEFFFDFSSSYGYIAATKVDALGARFGRAVEWNAMLLGAVFKVTGGQPLPMQPLKGDYSAHDFARSARFHGVPYRLPSKFPVGTVAASRAFWWLAASDPARARSFALAAFRAYFVDDINIGEADQVASVAATLGIDATALNAGCNDPATKERLKQVNDRAIERKVFGSPFFIVDGEPFWGVDRLPQLERWLDQGPF
jgi:2-hydroxychromene-2-carboxylate isomerase